MSTETNTRPNFLVVLTDDQGPWALSRTFPELSTPTIDKIVETSTVLNNFYCASPVCSPARASLLTGRMPSAHGIHDWIVGERHPDASEDIFLGGLATLPETLHQSGYVCAMSGKWHMGSSRFPAPGFDFWYAHRLGGGYYYDAPIWNPAGEKTTEERYFTYAVAEEACKFLDEIGRKNRANSFRTGINTPGVNLPESVSSQPDQPDHNSTVYPSYPNTPPDSDNSNQPFYLQVNFTAPHDPWINNHPQDLYDLYKDCDFESVPREERHAWTKHGHRPDFDDAFVNPVPYIQGYAASLSGVDRALSWILDRLRANGLYDNTVIIYMSDNGFSCGHHGIWGKGNGTWPLNFWENSVRVPFIAHLPGQNTHREIDSHVSACGYFSTICNLAGVTPPEDPLRAGTSFANLLAEDAEDSHSVVVYDEYGGGRMIRNGQWKLVDRYDGPREIYNLNEDPDERDNIAGSKSHYALEQDLSIELQDWFKQHETKMDSAYKRDVRGVGQIHPPRKMYDDKRTYVHKD